MYEVQYEDYCFMGEGNEGESIWQLYDSRKQNDHGLGDCDDFQSTNNCYIAY